MDPHKPSAARRERLYPRTFMEGTPVFENREIASIRFADWAAQSEAFRKFIRYSDSGVGFARGHSHRRFAQRVHASIHAFAVVAVLRHCFFLGKSIREGLSE